MSDLSYAHKVTCMLSCCMWIALNYPWIEDKEDYIVSFFCIHVFIYAHILNYPQRDIYSPLALKPYQYCPFV